MQTDISAPVLDSGKRSEGLISELVNIIERANLAYYRVGSQAIMADDVYDQYKHQLKQLDPQNPTLTQVGLRYSPEELRSKVTHKHLMGSLDNLDGGKAGLAKWLGSAEKVVGKDPELMLSHKMDGSSVCAYYVDGRLKQVLTRGNGIVGDDITLNAAMFKGMPHQLSQAVTLEVRGEAILSKSAFRDIVADESEDEISNPRNVGNGIIGRDDGANCERVDFVAFNVYCSSSEFSTENEKFEYLGALGFNCVPHFVTKADGFEKYHDEVLAARAGLDFEIDGIVVSLNSTQQQALLHEADRARPKYARACKFPSYAAVTKVLGVSVSVGHTGAIIPTAELQRVRVGGVFVTRALLNNWDEIDRLGIGPGDMVEVILAGDIIPKIVRVIEKCSEETFLEPNFCPSCGSPSTRSFRGTVGAVSYCSSPATCPAVKIGKVSHWIGSSKKGIGILGLGDAVLEALFASGQVAGIPDLYKLSIADLADLEVSGSKLGQSRAALIHNNIHAKRSIALPVFLGALGVDLLGSRRAKLLIEAAGGQLDTLDKWLDFDHFMRLDIPGLGGITRDAIVDGLRDCVDLVRDLYAVGVRAMSCESSSVVSDLPFAGLSFCLTGTRECSSDIERLGGSLKSGVSKGLTYLVQKDPLSKSTKTIKAEQYGVKIISIDHLKRAVAGEVSLQ